MSVVQTYRFNWMGHEGTTSESLNLALICHADVTNLRYAEYCRRQEVLSDMLLRLKVIKHELGLLPPEEDLSAFDEVEDIDAPLAPEAPAAPEAEEKVPAAIAAIRQRIPRGGEGDEGEEVVYIYPAPPTVEETKVAVRAAGGALRSLLTEAGVMYVSYIDGAEFTSPAALAAHNDAKRAAMDSTELPDPSDFDVAPLEAALEKRNQLRLKLDALRAARDPEYAATCVPASERDNSGKPITNVDAKDADEAKISRRLTTAIQQLATQRAAYNKRASESANKIQLQIANQIKPAEM